jgi:hypothetical protein
MHDAQGLVTTIATLATAMLFTMTTSNAATYKFTFQSNDAELTATGEFTVIQIIEDERAVRAVGRARKGRIGGDPADRLEVVSKCNQIAIVHRDSAPSRGGLRHGRRRRRTLADAR